MSWSRLCMLLALLVSTLAALGCAAVGTAPPRRNVIVFVADGLRAGSVNAVDTPTMERIRQQGVSFANSHSLFPTFTTPNASAIATGHYLGDTGDFSNTVYTGFPMYDDATVALALGKSAGSVTPFLENNQVLADVDEHFANRNFLNEETLLSSARKAGYQTAAIGKLGPVGIQAVTQLSVTASGFGAADTVIIDDNTGHPDAAGVAQSPTIRSDVAAALTRAGLGLAAAARNQPAGTVVTAGTRNANAQQQQYFADAATKAVLPTFRDSGKPFVLVYWSRDPDGSQHNQGDSLNTLSPGINGPTSVAGVANADANLRQIVDYVHSDPGLTATTDIFVTADHGFATISKHETDAVGGVADSFATTFRYDSPTLKPEVLAGWLPPGFLAIDLAHALGLPLFDPDTQARPGHYRVVDPSGSVAGSAQRPLSGNGVLGGSGALAAVATEARLIVAANGGSDLIYLPRFDPPLLEQTVRFLLKQNYVGGLFVNSRYGPIPGTLPLTAINLEGSAQFPTPSIAVAFRTFALDARNPLQTAILIADTTLQEGQGMHGSLGRDNTCNFMAAIGPDFKAGFVDPAPASNADIARTLAHILRLPLPSNGKLEGRVLHEALVHGHAEATAFERHRTMSVDPLSGRATVLEFQSVGGQRYFDQACLVDVAGTPTDGQPHCP